MEKKLDIDHHLKYLRVGEGFRNLMTIIQPVAKSTKDKVFVF